MKSYPIWMDITSCIYKNSKSYGIRQDGQTNVLVGTSARNSHAFATIRITHRDMGELGKSFRLYIDDEVIKEGIVRDGELFFTGDSAYDKEQYSLFPEMHQEARR